MNKISVIFVIFIAFGFSKKYFSGNGDLYLAICTIPFLYTLCVLGFHTRRSILSLIFVGVISFLSSDYAIRLVPSTIMFAIDWERIRIDVSDKSLLIFSAFSLAYGVFQKQYGYSAAEWEFIFSEVGSLKSEGVTFFEELRATSFFNSIQNYTLFAAFVTVYGFCRKNWWLLLVGVASLYLGGSRGVIIGCGITMIMCYFKSVRILSGFLLTLVIFQLLVLLPSTGFLDWKDDSNRMLVYGTFGYRLFVLDEYFSTVETYEVLFGLKDPRAIYDNIYLNILANIGAVGVIAILAISREFKQQSDYTRALLSVCVAYGVFSDILFDLYAIFIVALFIQIQRGRRLKGLEGRGKKPRKRRVRTPTLSATKSGLVN
ncbi:hypothetical protein OAK70_03760 [Akkermansiaceae bacterium]|nr:hypothetical protein [Akkermansiaceae bacterium]